MLLVCVGRGLTVLTTLGLPQSKVVCASVSTLAQDPGFSARTLSQVSPCIPVLLSEAAQVFSGTLCAPRPSWDMHFVSFPGPSSSGDWSAWQMHCPWWAVHLNHLPGPSLSPGTTRTPSQVYHVCLPSRSWISGCNTPGQMPTIQDPRKTWLATRACLQFGCGGCLLLGLQITASLCLLAWLSHTSASLCLRDVGIHSQLALLFGIRFILCSMNMLVSALEPFLGKFSTPRPSPPPQRSHGLVVISGYLSQIVLRVTQVWSLP